MPILIDAEGQAHHQSDKAGEKVATMVLTLFKFYLAVVSFATQTYSTC